MTSPVLNPAAVCQIGIMVHDIEATARRYCEIFGFDMPPIIQTKGYEAAKTMYNGEPCYATAKLAFFNLGQLSLELIQPDETPSVWRDFLNERGEGVHHVAFQVANTGETVNALAERGIPLSQQGLYSDASGMYTYVDSGPLLGVMVELLENFKTNN